MKRKHLIVTLMLLISAVYAQAQGGGGQRGERPDPKVQAKTQTDTWQEAFGLSDDQHKKTYEILLKASDDRNKKMTAMRESGDRDGMEKAMKDLTTELDASLKKVFTEAQWPLYEQWKIDNPPQQRGRRGGN